jgi:4'-phosphopantetheinyl transferase
MLYVDDQIEQFDLLAALAAVSEQRRDHALRYRKEHDRRLSVAVYRLLQRALREEYGIMEPPVFAFGEHGKPTLTANPNIHFSLSHCDAAAACVVSCSPVGIDLECLDRFDADLIEQVMNDDERQQITCSSNPPLTFMCLWTMKESLLKMTGEGIASDMRQVLTTHPLATTCRFHTTVYPQFVCTVCVLS